MLAVAESELSSSPAGGGVDGREGMRSALSNLAWNVARGALLPPARLLLPAPLRDLVPYDEPVPTLPPPWREGATEFNRDASIEGARRLGAEEGCSGVLVPPFSSAVSSPSTAALPLRGELPLAN